MRNVRMTIWVMVVFCWVFIPTQTAQASMGQVFVQAQATDSGAGYVFTDTINLPRPGGGGNIVGMFIDDTRVYGNIYSKWDGLLEWQATVDDDNMEITFENFSMSGNANLMGTIHKESEYVWVPGTGFGDDGYWELVEGFTIPYTLEIEVTTIDNTPTTTAPIGISDPHRFRGYNAYECTASLSGILSILGENHPFSFNDLSITVHFEGNIGDGGYPDSLSLSGVFSGGRLPQLEIFSGIVEGHTVSLNLTATVPEPATLLLFGLGGLALRRK